MRKYVTPILMAIPLIGNAQGVTIDELNTAVSAYGANVVKDEVGVTLELPKRVTFGFDAADVQEKESLKALAAFFNMLPNRAVVHITGNADTPGDKEYNKQLGLKRASMVAKQLMGYGVDGTRIIIKSAGNTSLLVPSNGRERLNRRVDIRISMSEVQG